MEQEILVSVIVPCYNIEDCLERCVDSIRQQTLRELEILLVDDGSTDGTGRLCDSFAAMDSRIRVFHKENGGSSSARNLGIDSARGQWLGFVDSDDWIEPEMYERLLETARFYKTDIAQASRDEIGEDGQRRPDVCRAPDRVTVWEAEPFLRELLLHRGDCSFCTKLVRRELFEDRRFPEGKLNEDFFLLVGMLAEDHAICVLPQQMYHVFYRVGSNTRKRDPEEFSRVFEDIVENADLAEKLAAQKYPHLVRVAARFALIQRLDYLLHIPVSRMTGSDPFYTRVKRYLRSHLPETLTNPFLTGKNRIYLLLLTLAPRTVRRVHAAKMRRHDTGKKGTAIPS